MEATHEPREDEVRALMAALPVPTLLLRRDGDGDGLVVAAFNDAALRLTGGTVTGVVGQRAEDAYAHDPRVVADLARAIADGVPIVREGRFKLASNGAEIVMRIHAVPVGSDMVMLQAEDLSAQRRSEDLAGSMFAMERAFEDAPIGMSLVRVDGTYARANAALCKMIGRPWEELARMRWQDLVHPDDRAEAEEALRAMREGSEAPHRMEQRLLRPDGSELEVVKTLSLARDPASSQRYAVCQYLDISERLRYEHELERRALHDPLTGLPNRVLFSDRVGHALDRMRRSGDGIAVLFLDLDEFKRVNDSLGHGAGDHVLVETARRLEQAMRTGDTICRFGGDEFVVLCEDLDPACTDARALELSERLITCIANTPYQVGGHQVHLRGSVGVASARPDAPTTPERLIAESDAAMYRAKRGGGGRAELARDETSSATRRLSLESDLRAALREPDGLWLAYQPIVDLVYGHVAGLEALLRWNRPGHGAVSPAEIIPVAEESGLIVELGAWVLERAVSDLASWTAFSQAFVAINLAARQFGSDELVDDLRRCLSANAIEPNRVCLEITESVAMSDAETALTTMSDLKDVGVRIAIDDFGTGFSSLGYLKRFPADTVKIDRAFIAEVAVPSGGDRAIVRAVLSMADALDLDVVAEGVETAEQRAVLADLGCHRGQGFFFARPAPLAEAVAAAG